MVHTGVKDSDDPWKYVIVLGKFTVELILFGIVKSFGVLIPELVARFDSDYKTVGFICSLPLVMFITAPVGHLLYKVMNLRVMAMLGGILIAVPLMFAPLANSIYIFAMMMALIGFSVVLTIIPLLVSVNEYFLKSFIFANTLAHFGPICGALATPVITERSLEAYGYQGAFLILAGISLHAVVSGAVVRPPRDLQNKFPSTRKEGAPTLETATHSARDSGTNESLLQSQQRRFLASGKPFSSTDHTDAGTDDDDDPRDLKANKLSTPSVLSKLISCPLHIYLWLRSCIFVTEPLFTVALPAIFLHSYTIHAWMLFLVPHAEGFGIARSRAVLLSTIAGISGIFGKLLYLVLLYFSFDSTLIFCVSCGFCAASVFIDSVSSTFVFLGSMAFVQGFCLFMLQTLPSALMKLSVRNEENIPKAMSVYLCVVALGAVSGDTLSGHIFDVTSSYSTLFMSLGVVLAATLINLFIFAIVVRYKGTA